MFLTKAKGALAIVLAVALLGGAFTVGAYQSLGQAPPAQKAPAPPSQGDAQKKAPDPRVKVLFQEAEEDAAAIQDSFNRTAAFTAIARAHAKAGRREAAAALLRKALEAEAGEVGVSKAQHKDNRLSIIAECQAETGDLKGALETVEGSISASNNTSALASVAAAQARAGDIKGARATVERMRPVRDNDPFRDQALRQIAVIQAEAGDRKGALETSAGISQMSDKAFVLSAVAIAEAKAGNKKKAAEVIEQIRGILSGEGTPRNFGLHALATAQAAAGMSEDALNTANEITEAMWREGALWRIATLQARRGELKAARQAAEAIADGHRKGEALKEIVIAMVGAKDLTAAAREAAAIGDDIGRCYALMEVAKGQAAAGRKAEAKQILDDVVKLADRLENPPQMGGVRESALINYAETRAAAGDPDGALEWAGKQDDLWVRAMARLHVAQVLAGQVRK
jgi:tetratricopeptide (TPR) repeat protein